MAIDRTESSITHNESDSMISAAVKTAMTEASKIITSITKTPSIVPKMASPRANKKAKLNELQ